MGILRKIGEFVKYTALLSSLALTTGCPNEGVRRRNFTPGYSNPRIERGALPLIRSSANMHLGTDITIGHSRGYNSASWGSYAGGAGKQAFRKAHRGSDLNGNGAVTWKEARDYNRRLVEKRR